MSTREEKVWAGSEASLQTALEAELKIAAGSFGDMPKEDDSPRLLSVADGLATITIKGSLMNSDSPMLRYFGGTGYSEIRDALLAAVNDPEVKQILLDIDSGGGAVSGCDDTGNLIRSVHKLKPVTAYGDTMASAAYWLACSAGKVYSGKASLVGSIGTKATFKEFSNANKANGVTVTVIRAGKYKSLADSNEPLTPEARAQLQALVDSAYGVFVEHVAEMRGKTYAYADKTMADGQEFIGQAAVDVGLTDGVTTFDAVVGGLKKKNLASSQKSMDNRGSNSLRLSGSTTPPGDAEMAKKALTEADIAALAAGATITAEATTIEGASNGLQTTQEDAAQADTQVEAKAEAKPEDQAEVVAEKVVISDTTVQYLQSQVKEKDAALLEAHIKLAKVTEQLADAQASHAPLLAIAVKSVGNMAVALNGTSLLSAESSAVQVLAEHARVTGLFQAKFPIGGVAAVSSDEAPVKTQLDPRHIARVNAARFQK